MATLAPVRLLAHGTRPAALSAELLARLPEPFIAATRETLELDLDVLLDRQRGQLDASRLLEQLPATKLPGLLLALVEVDLFLPVLTYVFGASELGRGRSVLSLARLARDASPDQLLRRAAIEAAHELGHGLGLVHCPVPACPMHRTLWPEAIELKQLEPCPGCRAALQAALARSAG